MAGCRKRLKQVWGVVLLLGLGGCGAAPDPEIVPDEIFERARAEAQAQQEAAESAPPQTPPPAPERTSPTTVVLDEGAGSSRPKSLHEAAEAERQRRQAAREPIAVITDQNLSDYAARGQLTLMGPAAQEDRDATRSDRASQVAGQDENTWRQRGRDIRLRWRDAVDAIEELEGRVGELRRRFYAEDDPHFRDSRIKPAWDQALERLEAARRTAETAQEELREFLEEGRRAGVLPGWLREGVELEPEPVLDTEEDAADPGEPVVVGDGRR